MKNLFSFEDAKRFYKKQKFIVLSVTVVTVILYILLSVYNYYSVVVEEVEMKEPELSQEEIVEILNREPEDVLAEELRLLQESLDAEAVEFRVYIENVDQDPLNDPLVLKDFLILDEVVTFVETESDVEIPIERDLAVIVNKRDSHSVLSVQIRVGDFEDNVAIAEAYMTAFEQGEISLLNDKEFYLLDDEAAPYQEKIITQILENMTVFSPTSVLIGLFVAVILGVIMGVLVAILRASRTGKVDEMSILQENPTDTVLPFYKLSDDNKREEQLIYSILYPQESSKLVLSELKLEDRTEKILIDKNVDFVSDLSEADPNKKYNEIIILTQLDQTSKKWYNNQRIQLKNTKSDIKIIQL